MIPNLKILDGLESIRSVVPAITLLGVFERESSGDRLDLLISAPSLSPLDLESIRVVERALREKGGISNEDMCAFNAIMVLDSDDPFTIFLNQEVGSFTQIQAGFRTTGPVADLDVVQGYLLVCDGTYLRSIDKSSPDCFSAVGSLPLMPHDYVNLEGINKFLAGMNQWFGAAQKLPPPLGLQVGWQMGCPIVISDPRAQGAGELSKTWLASHYRIAKEFSPQIEFFVPTRPGLTINSGESAWTGGAPDASFFTDWVRLSVPHAGSMQPTQLNYFGGPSFYF